MTRNKQKLKCHHGDILKLSVIIEIIISTHFVCAHFTWKDMFSDTESVKPNYLNHTSIPRTSQVPYFPCPIHYHEPYPPSSANRTVNQLRPQDVEIVASLGDSITAGTGALASNLLEVLDENRGSTYFTGGDGDWKTCPSIYNIIKNYNYNIQGGAFGSTRVFEIPFKRKGFGERGLNLSVSGAVAEDVPEMARSLVKKVRKMPGWRHKWKMVSILIGGNDLCSKSCVSTLQALGLSRRVKVEPRDFERNVRKTLDILARDLPRTFVVLMSPIDVTIALDIVNKPKTCVLSHLYECPCLFGNEDQGGKRRVKWLVESYRKIAKQLSFQSQYNRDDFTVEYLPTLEIDLPEVRVGGRSVPDLSLLAPDCFHFMKELHGRLGRNLWNNLLQPGMQKTLDFSRQPRLICPSTNLPYFSTKLNSV